MGRLIEIVLVVFSVYRLSSLIASEEGPYIGWPKTDQQTGIFKAIRIKTGVYNYGFDGKPETNLARGISCPLCVSFYICVLILILKHVKKDFFNSLVNFFGIWGMQTYLENLTSDEAIQDAIYEVAESIGEEDENSN